MLNSCKKVLKRAKHNETNQQTRKTGRCTDRQDIQIDGQTDKQGNK